MLKWLHHGCLEFSEQLDIIKIVKVNIFNGKDSFLLMPNIHFHDAQISLLHKVEVGNFALQACNVRDKRHTFVKASGKFWNLRISFLFWALPVKYLQRNFQSGIRTALNTFFCIFSKVFGVGISKHPHHNICDGV